MEPKSTMNPASANPRFDDSAPNFDERLALAEERLLETNERVKSFIRENPGTCLLGAAAFGILAGSWASRR